MSILIKGMEMPKEQITAVINPNGLVEILSLDNVLLDEFYAVEVKPHGRLTDADALYTELAKRKSYGELSAKSALRAVANAPTIIPATKEET